jgi:23S rRNA (uridine2552-2'-O)-methyltransferase
MVLKTHNIKTRVKTAKGRKLSSTLWLQRQLNDPYVKEANRLGYRSRAAFKLIELNDKYHFLAKGKKIVDLGAAPGGWSQIAVQKTASTQENPLIVGIDLLPVEPMAGARFIQMDFMDDKAPFLLKQTLGGKADVVLSDMAPNTSGIHKIDSLRLMGLLESAYAFAKEILAPNGVFIAKIFQGGTENTLLSEMKKDFELVKHAKPEASRKDSSEFYVVAKGYRGKAVIDSDALKEK